MPEVKEIRERIQNISRTWIRLGLQYQYLTASRVSEVCGKWAIKGKDFWTTTYEDNEVIIFNVRSAKKDGLQRSVALPLTKEFEPWIYEIKEYFEYKKSKKKVFNYTPRTLQNYGSEAFDGLEYDIAKYKGVKRHKRKMNTHALRHIRATELMMIYGFDGIDISIFCGWEMKRFAPAMPDMAKRYIYGQWARYFPKLLKKNIYQ